MTSYEHIAEATRLLREGKLAESTALLQRWANGDARSVAPPPPTTATRILDVDAVTGEVSPADRLLARFAKPALRRAAATESPSARFRAGNFADARGSRAYKLYVPANLPADEAPPLLVMLHGCTQSPDDFAAGTRMNALAEEVGMLVVYPAQSPSANAQRCWNWFSPEDQRRDAGEPALIAGITRQVIAEHGADPRRVHVAGLSAGGAAAAIMGTAYPDLYTAVGVHSGLACGSARDVGSAFAAMRSGGAGSAKTGEIVPTIVFHADRDTTVNPINGDQVIAQSGGGALRAMVERGQVPGGHGWTRTMHQDTEGRVMLEQWVVHGGGHAWSGGSADGTYTDPRGPDASREMLRFFAQHGR